MAIRWAITNGNWSSTSTWNSGTTLGIPTVGDDVWANSFTVNMDVNATVTSLNTTARNRDIATPLMTANNVPSPYVAAASNLADSTQPFQAFDRNTTGTQWSAINPPQWLSMDFGAGNSQVIDGYTIFGGTTQAENPRVWEFQGSDNNTTWTTVHSFSGATGIASSGSYSIASIGNAQAYRYYRLNISAIGGVATRTRVNELEMYLTGTTSLAIGGSFNFNTSGVTVTCDLIRQGVTNMMTVTHTTGDVTINVGSNINAVAGQTTISHTGSGNLILTCPNLITTQNTSTTQVIGKSSSGLITINGNLIFGVVNTSTVNYVLNSTNGNTIINGNVVGNSSQASSATAITVRQTAGTLIINGNVTPTGLPAASLNAGVCSILFQGTLLTLNGNTLGGDGLSILSTGNVNVIGNLRGGNSVNPNSTIAINITGDTYAGLAPAINASAFPNSTVNITGNMYNNLGWNAIWCPNVFVSNSVTTTWRMDVGGGIRKTLYSADIFPNLPATTSVRFNTVYGPSNSLTGTTRIPLNSNIRSGVIYDNGTVGTGSLTAQDIINYISSSSDSLAVRLRNILTVEQAGGIIKENNV